MKDQGYNFNVILYAKEIKIKRYQVFIFKQHKKRIVEMYLTSK